jgi:mRNA interferase YafQ
MLKIRYTSKFKKDYKAVQKRGNNIKLFQDVLSMLCNEQPLPQKHFDHSLSGDYIGHRECHIAPDWLLIYKVEQNILTLTLTRTGTHSDLF